MRIFRFFTWKPSIDLFRERVFEIYENVNDKKALKNVLSAFKENPDVYKSDLESVIKLYFMLRKEKGEEVLVGELEKQIIERHESVDFDDLITFSMLCKPHERSIIIPYILSNTEKFSDLQITTFASILPTDNLLVSLHKSKRLSIDSLEIAKNILTLTKSALIQLEISRLLPNLFRTQDDLLMFIEILLDLEMKNEQIAQNLIPAFEKKVLELNPPMNFMALKSLLRLCNQKGVHSCFTPKFYKYLISAVQTEISRPNVVSSSFYLSLFGKESFYVESIFQSLIQKFKSEFLTYKQYEHALFGFEGISVSVFFDSDLLNLFNQFLTTNIEKMNSLELIRVLKLFINQGCYIETHVNKILNLLEKDEYLRSCEKMKIFLSDNLELILIDLPELELKINNIQKNIKVGMSGKNFIVSNTQGYVAQVLRANGIDFEENIYINTVYEIDFLIEKKIVVEAIGTLYHFNLFSNVLIPKTLAKLRYLKKLGFKTILTVNKESTENNLKKSIFFLKNFPNVFGLLLLESEIQVVNIPDIKKYIPSS